jgi:hypothetical protein
LSGTGDDQWTKAALRLAYLLMGAWSVSFMVDLIDRSYDPPPTIGPLMLIAAGSLLGENIVRRTVKRDRDQDDTDRAA